MKMVTGVIEGTGAAIYVGLGFIPDKVVLRNRDDAGALFPTLEWLKDQADGAAAQAGGTIAQKTAAAQTLDVTFLTAAQGVAAYNGGDELVYDAAQSRWETTAGAASAEVYVDRTGADFAAAQVDGTPANLQRVKTIPGFSIGTNAHINADGEDICFVAYGADVSE